MSPAIPTLRQEVELHLQRIARRLPMGSQLVLVLRTPGAMVPHVLGNVPALEWVDLLAQAGRLPVVRLQASGDLVDEQDGDELAEHAGTVAAATARLLDAVPLDLRAEVTLAVLAGLASGFLGGLLPEHLAPMRARLDAMVSRRIGGRR